ncbi:MAG TPA: 4-(cytidine 5'-diphospho)-2-C-methyl-D-erythritol kinase [Dehalococcoidia bacterium]|jgi:4-diphosphocytidyl-2-C-methyl-D-erythritol kinase
MLKYLAPAKINLVLEVLGKRDDGYHEIRSLVQAISLCDTLTFELSDTVSLKCSQPSLEAPDNLVIKAAELLRQAGGHRKGARIKLEKRIPWGAGLGGGSSDAAAALLALNTLWGLKLTTPELINIAAKLGSDVPFFIYRGAAVVEGRGEKVNPVQVSARSWFVLLVPPLPKIPDKTRRLYAGLDKHHFTDGHYVEAALKCWSKNLPVAPDLLFNVFDTVAIETFTGLEDYRKRFEEAGAKNIQLAGSGPALFATVDSESRAKELQRRLRRQKLETHAVSTILKI